MKRAVLALVAAPLLMAQAKPVLVPDVSERQIDIVYSFTGARLLLFGAIAFPDGSAPDKDVDIVVVLRGPVESIRIREKQRVAGIWVNADSTRFRSVPVYYAVASSRPLREIVDERTASIFEMGVRNLQLSPVEGAAPERERRFIEGLVDLRKRNGLYIEDPKAVEITDHILYRAKIDIPARVPVGTFTAETFMVKNGRVIAAASRDIDIRKSGFERFVAVTADQKPFAYGIVAVLLSLLFGWAAGALFRRMR